MKRKMSRGNNVFVPSVFQLKMFQLHVDSCGCVSYVIFFLHNHSISLFFNIKSSYLVIISHKNTAIYSELKVPGGTYKD